MDLMTEGEAIRLVGDNVSIYASPGVSIALGDTATVVIADPRDDVGVGGVWNSGRFRLVGPLAAEVEVRLFGHPPTSPQWDWRQRRDERPMHLLSRLPEGCLYLGLGKLRSGGGHGRAPYFAEFAIDPELSDATLDRVRPPTEPEKLPGIRWLTEVASSPVEALAGFVDGWFSEASMDPEDVLPGRWKVPDPLASFYGLARRYPGLLGVQNYITAPQKWHREDGGLIAFGHENQGGFTWLFDPSSADPTVWVDDHVRDEPRCEGTLSSFLLRFALFEAWIEAPYKAWSDGLSLQDVARLTASWSALPWEPWACLLDGPVRFYVAPGLIALVIDDKDGSWVYASAVHRSVLRRLRSCEIDWRQFDG